jgi:hypothetical protein
MISCTSHGTGGVIQWIRNKALEELAGKFGYTVHDSVTKDTVLVVSKRTLRGVVPFILNLVKRPGAGHRLWETGLRLERQQREVDACAGSIQPLLHF